jgi:hypothetical protein
MPGRVEAADESPCSATAMRKATRRMTQLYDDALAPAGLRTTQYAILEALHRKADAPPSMGELAETLVLDRSALGKGECSQGRRRSKGSACQDCAADRGGPVP